MRPCAQHQESIELAQCGHSYDHGPPNEVALGRTTIKTCKLPSIYEHGRAHGNETLGLRHVARSPVSLKELRAAIPSDMLDPTTWPRMVLEARECPLKARLSASVKEMCRDASRATALVQLVAAYKLPSPPQKKLVLSAGIDRTMASSHTGGQRGPHLVSLHAQHCMARSGAIEQSHLQSMDDMPRDWIVSNAACFPKAALSAQLRLYGQEAGQEGEAARQEHWVVACATWRINLPATESGASFRLIIPAAPKELRTILCWDSSSADRASGCAATRRVGSAEEDRMASAAASGSPHWFRVLVPGSLAPYTRRALCLTHDLREVQRDRQSAEGGGSGLQQAVLGGDNSCEYTAFGPPRCEDSHETLESGDSALNCKLPGRQLDAATSSELDIALSSGSPPSDATHPFSAIALAMSIPEECIPACTDVMRPPSLPELVDDLPKGACKHACAADSGAGDSAGASVQTNRTQQAAMSTGRRSESSGSSETEEESKAADDGDSPRPVGISPEPQLPSIRASGAASANSIAAIVNSSTELPAASSAAELGQAAPSQIHRIPRHIAVVMDGNGRWAQRRGQPRSDGHRAGVEAILRTVRAARELGIEVLTLYAFSAQNWDRPDHEVRCLMALLVEFLKGQCWELVRNGVKLLVMGDVARLPTTAQMLLRQVLDASKSNTAITLCLALSYGGREEIALAASAACRACENGLLSSSDVGVDTVQGFLHQPNVPDPDLLIRTGGEQRLSNFLLWQCAYSELLFVDVAWPDFGAKDLGNACRSFSERKRRFGKTQEQMDALKLSNARGDSEGAAGAEQAGAKATVASAPGSAGRSGAPLQQPMVNTSEVRAASGSRLGCCDGSWCDCSWVWAGAVQLAGLAGGLLLPSRNCDKPHAD